MIDLYKVCMHTIIENLRIFILKILIDKKILKKQPEH